MAIRFNHKPSGSIVGDGASGFVFRHYGEESTDRTVTITGTGASSYAYVQIDGVKYTSATVLTVPVGTEITCKAYARHASYDSLVVRNGTVVCVNEYNGVYTYAYDFYVSKNVNIHLEYLYGYYDINHRSVDYVITITDT